MDQEEFREYLTQYREWLTEQYRKDNLERVAGLSPLPRSRDEKAAIFWNLPRNLRKQSSIHRRYLGYRL